MSEVGYQKESVRAKVLLDMAPLFVEARAKGLAFFCQYQHMWMSPDELEAAHRDGRFIWGVDNWQLRDPNDCVRDVEHRLAAAQIAVDAIKEWAKQFPAPRGTAT